MNGAEIVLWILFGLVMLIVFISFITFVIYKSASQHIKQFSNIYLGKLENTDASIQQAMKYLKLTNSINESDARR